MQWSVAGQCRPHGQVRLRVGHIVLAVRFGTGALYFGIKLAGVSFQLKDDLTMQSPEGYRDVLS